ncbi:cytokine receptor-like factor 2 isoform X5 [Mus caroli]|uniref:Cytokine receptor-like factor 2 n=1 Tax=Mus caroli TaxID=10089 RepID=A0A6P7QVF7_MUSCR|nr:cytokine receptor-like factor 2 isoform X5 [Mus caroli]
MAWALAVILVPRLLAAAAVAAAAAAVVTSRGDVTVVCHDLEMVEVTWGLGPNHQGANLSLEFRYGTGALRPCPQYFLSGAGVTSGCILPAARVGLLELALRDGGGAMVFKARQRASTWLKPSPPRNLTLLWTPDGDVAVSWPAHSYLGLDYEVQHRENSNGNEDAWQTTSGPCCDLMVGGLDPARCYDFRVRASPRAAHYGLEAQPSEWTAVTKLSGAASTALRLRRVKDALLPCVPDPSGSFPGLFEKHHGNFQNPFPRRPGSRMPRPPPHQQGRRRKMTSFAPRLRGWSLRMAPSSALCQGHPASSQGGKEAGPWCRWVGPRSWWATAAT